MSCQIFFPRPIASKSETLRLQKMSVEYVYKPMQNTANFETVKIDNFDMKKSDIDCVYALEPPY